MNNSTIKVLEVILRKNYESLKEFNRDLGLSLSTISEAILNLKNYSFEFDNSGYKLISNKMLTNFNNLLNNYNLNIFKDARESILYSLLFFNKLNDISGYVNLSDIHILRNLNYLREKGVVYIKDESYFLKEDLKPIIKDIFETIIAKSQESDAELIIKKGIIFKILPKGKLLQGKLTAFSKFNDYGLIYYTVSDYGVDTKEQLSIEDIFVHALLLSNSKKDLVLCTCFYLKNKYRLNLTKLRKKLSHFEIYPVYEKMIDYIRTGADFGLFLPKKEFIRILNEYDLSLDLLTHKENLISFFEDLEKLINIPLKVYLIGGCNLVLRNLKNVTKDIDVIVNSETEYLYLEKILLSLQFVRDTKLSNQTEHLRIRMVFKKDNNQIDVFVKRVMNQIFLNDSMIKKSETKNFGKLDIKLVSLEDIILFKAIAGREGDIEDISRIIERKDINWNYLYNQFILQFDNSNDLLFLSILDTFDIINKTNPIPILSKIERFVLEKSILFVCKTPKSIPKIKKILEFPDHTIRNVINKQVKDGLLKSILGKPMLFQTI
ncbi:MAG: hypothetical protein COT14_00475 [Candidatus Diapherotrites archaeon CG08_land_8_20_14_0_20_30_16]|nr:MAG: hypothetical protein COT14_00475 [Candidatus Diapherotrites archaeon CG08_land_8_20_14_0_20_30_16]